MPILHHISANSHTCGSDAITFVGSISSSEVTIAVCYNLWLLGFCLPKIGEVNRFSVSTCKNFQFWPFLSFDKFQVFSVSNVISCCLMAFVADLKWCKHRRPCFRSRKHHRRILALTPRLAGLALHVQFWLSLTSQLRRCQGRSQWFVPVYTRSVSKSHPLATLTRLLSGFAHVLLTTSISGSIVEDIPSFPDHVGICLSRS